MQLRSGQHWEAVAARYLEDRGLQVLARGYRCRLGELDLVCRDGVTLVIVEVRARATTSFAAALESIDYRKQRRIVQATRHLLMRHAEWHTAPIRFDVVAFDAIDTPSPRVQWVRNAFDAG
jgi:putative endonuclease